MQAEKQAMLIRWDEIDKYEFELKWLLKMVVQEKVAIDVLQATPPIAWSDGTPVGREVVRKFITRALANLAVAALGDVVQ